MARRRKRGRPDKLTPKRRRQILELIRAGNYMEIAAQAAGISPATLYRWLERGEKARSGKYREFREAVMRARVEAEANAVEMVRAAAPRDWRAAAFLLERSFPQRWGRRQKLEHSGPDGGPIPTEVRVTLVRPAAATDAAGEDAGELVDAGR